MTARGVPERWHRFCHAWRVIANDLYWARVDQEETEMQGHDYGDEDPNHRWMFK